METEQPDCSLISLDNSQETIENDQTFEKVNNIENRSPDNLKNEQQKNNANSCAASNINNNNSGGPLLYSSAALPDVNNSLISDDEDDEGNLADGSAAEYTNTEKSIHKKLINKNNSGSSTGKCNTSKTENECTEVKTGTTGSVTAAAALNGNGNARKCSASSLSRKQVSRQTANTRNQKHDKITSNIKRKSKHLVNNSSTATSATEPRKLSSSSNRTLKLTEKSSHHPKIKPAFNNSTSIVPHNYSPPSRKLSNSKQHNSSHSSTFATRATTSTVNTSDTGGIGLGNSPSKPFRSHHYTNNEARARREAQLNKPTRTASKHFQETHNPKNINRKSSIVEANSSQLPKTAVFNQHLRRKSYRPGSAPPVKLTTSKTSNTRGTGQSSREDSTTDAEKFTQKENYNKDTPTRPVSAATLKMRARRQQDQVHLQRTGTAGDVQVRRLARLSLQGKVGNAPSPKTKTVGSKIGSLDNKNHIPGGGAVKIYDQSPNFKKSAHSKVGSLDNAKHSPGGGNVKIETKKLDLRKVTSKCGSLENSKHVPGGGNVKILDQKIKINAASKIGSLENKTHSPGGGNVKILNKKIDLKHVTSKSGSLENASHKPNGGNVKIFDQKLNFKKSAKSKVGSMDNIKHQPGGGDVIVYDEANLTTRKFLEASLVEERSEENEINSDNAKGDF